jgi:pimeloyl-ACP methyl ester carboxylesterase
VIAEYRGFALASEQIHQAGEFGDYPVRVLTATDHDGSRAREELWQSMAASLAAESTSGQQVTVRGSGHYIQLDRPADVVKAILSVLPSTAQ